MKIKLATLISILFCNLLISQEVEEKLSISFDNISKPDLLKKLENKTNYSFFYNSDWFEKDSISGNYQDIQIDELLDTIFSTTNINYFLFEGNKVILTNNNIIYDEFPERFFGIDNNDTNKIKKTYRKIAPIFYEESKSKVSQDSRIYRVGKQNKKNNQSFFSLSGYITKDGLAEPIDGLSIRVKGENKGTITDLNGFYEIKLKPGLNTLEMRALGIEKSEKKVVIYNDGILNFKLNESLEQLDEVTVSADIFGDVEEVISGTEQIDIEESKNIPLVLGERDVLKVATALPGITTAGEGAAGFNVRGGRTDQNLILFDNAVLYSPQHFFGIFSALNPFAIGEFNIYKGNIPAEYGGRLSSVFEIKSKNGNTSKFSGEASIGPVTSNLVLEIPVVKDKSSLLLGGRGAYANWILRSIDEESLNNSQASFYDFMASYSHTFNDKNNIKATAYLSRDDFSITSDSLFIYSNKLISLNWNHKINEKNTASFTLSNSEYDFNIEFDRGENDDFNLNYTINETGLKMKFNYLHSSKLRFDYGIEGKLYDVKPGSIEGLSQTSIIEPLTIEKERGLESAGFVSGRYDINKKLSVDAGLRYSFYAALGEGSERLYSAGSPRNEGTVVDTLLYDNNEIIEAYGGPEFRLAARYLINPDLSIKASYGNTIQYIHRLTNNTTVSPIDTWKLSDGNIKPQRGRQFSLGAFKNFDSGLYEISLEGFYKNSDDILDFKTGADLLLNENIETEVIQGEGKSYGLEFLIRKNKGKLNGWLGYTYSRSFIKFDSPFSEERINNGEFFPSNFDRPHDISLVTNYKFTRRFSLSANFVYQTGRPVTVPVGTFNFNNAEFSVFSDRNSFRIPDFYRMDFGFNIEGNHKRKKFAHSFWTISIYNVLGRNNPFSVFFLTENGEVKAVQSSIFSIPVPSITYNFKF
ncbi:carboxypeptidase-like regulatory domain-containing protein [Costertonia aggregata]|uniref:TonB-dependent receptor n=1 Tax=Costertonia aggregata TaxID=343403 RepID=A0A7H9ATK6_9FLAO|nr:carboxypeptidase-like regulatory domain-containing protein [Costertonia aggregata]QLG46821.1 TonB-dependent receptor [Costertonia aggregata]